MSLDNIQLTPFVLESLFSKSLYDSKPANPGSGHPEPGTIMFLGDNQKRISILVNSPDTLYLPEEELNFLMGVLSACKLSMADIALINISKSTLRSYTEIAGQLQAEKVFLFGIEPEALGMPLQFPHYQLQHFNNQVYLSSVSLTLLQSDKKEKLKLWNSLKKVFSIE